jgi:hypothetical protein
MTSARFALGCLVVLAVGCKKADGLVLVDITSSPALSDVTAVSVTVTAGGKTSQPASVSLASTAIPPDLHVALQLPASVSGAVTVHVDANSASAGTVSGEAMGHLDAGKSSTPILITLSPNGGGSDGGMPDLSEADLTLEPPSTPQLLAPLSGTTVTSRHPTLHWALPGGIGTATVDLCARRDCSILITGSKAVVDASNTKATVDIDLPPGVVFWRVNVSHGTVAPTQSATWEFFVGARSADNAIDVGYGSVLDVNGDGLADLLVGVSGQAILYPGASTGLDTANKETLNDGDNGFASAVSSAGDVNGDGYVDAIAGAVFADTDMGSNVGRVLLYLGGVNKLGTSPITLPIPAANGDAIGTALATAGDIDGDGYADMVVGATGNSPGRVWVVFGGPSGTSRVVELKPSDKMLTGDDLSGAQFGTSVAGGDFNGDGLGDVAIGAPGVTQMGKPSGNGRVYVYYGGTGFPTTPEIVDGVNFTGCCGSQAFGTTVAEAGDFNGDGRDDLVVVAPFAQYQYTGCGDSPTAMIDGMTYIYYGAATGAPTIAVQLPAKEYNAGCGYVTGDIQNRAAAGAGDVNGDGYADVIVGGLYAVNGGFTNAGAAHLLLGGAFALGGHVDIPSPAPATGGQFGSVVGGVGSVTGTGTPPQSSFVVIGNSQIYRFTGTGTAPAQNFTSIGVTTVTRLAPPRRGLRSRGHTIAL